ncbi:hypothetical protein PLICRDRAFT_148152 [Plicaturopsis crispa FD-325 SS-3]|uniref:AAA+ ATPase domain-containing protein n=1 Tax=Plicaturopsis crispa FD-325 SS-3 TaxID=944288 RepID=A0A0C9T295_PLICR|nr:hypothetical protein PLICRDRAFT_148152 [Plicaturopsis crispa FD-325 SS-3]
MHEPENDQQDPSSVDIENHLVPENPADLFGEGVPVRQDFPEEKLTIKVPPMVSSGGPVYGLRRSARRRTSSADGDQHQPSGSEYHESEKSMEVDPQPEPEPSPPVEYATTQRGRRIARKSYRESASEDDFIGEPDGEPAPRTKQQADDDEDEEDHAPRRSGRRRNNNLGGFIATDEESENGAVRYQTRSRNKKPPPKPAANGQAARPARKGPSDRARRMARRSARAKEEDGEFNIDDGGSSGSADGDGSMEDAPRTSSDVDADGEPDEGEVEQEAEGDGKPYALRQRAKINYAIPPPLEDMRPPPKPRSGGGRAGGGGHGGGRNGGRKGPGWSATGAELGRWMGMAGDDSDSDYNTRTPRKPFGAGAGGVFGGGAAVAGGGAGGMMPSDLAAAAGTPSNLGKVGDAALADADPLGVNTNVTFDEVGGLDDHIHALKEMTLLPLLYPEVFQRFDVTPPRGVLFHGPPGTGKTLLARALAASCRTNGKAISFFMRKGADCLSKWVGEAERQLRLLFEEARNCQPSIIFFDEIDGLAPVRSSKQDQIHASIVSTLLALMDGMDGRGQVVVIGATNRPDAIDPALRRPGRFDREFYFPLPGLEARERILGIMTKKWDGWDGEKGVESVKGLAKLTKGYGGADLRALCTEATLNAIQRRYPQIYQSNERLLLEPETIGVGLRDFMISVKKLVPSAARSTSSSASPLPSQFVPLLQDALDKVKNVIDKVLPISKKRTALEEAEFEDDGEEGALEREIQMQHIETLRVYRPRVILHGPVGMGQGYVGAAALHHLEGYHVQTLELGSLMSDSTRTIEAAIVQLFVEAKRHQPSVIYIPSLVGWCAAVSETSRSTVRAMLETLAPTDPILLLAVVDGPYSALPRDVRSWFGPTKDNRVELTKPDPNQREKYFLELVNDIKRPPNEFADGVKRKKRILEKLPIAPPIEPRQPTAAELAVQEENDQRTIALLKYRLGPILTELKRKFKRFTKRATDEYTFDAPEYAPAQVETVTTTVEVREGPNGVVEVVDEQRTTEEHAERQINGVGLEQQQQQMERMPPLYDMDLERMHVELYKGKYLTPKDFLDDVGKIVHNAAVHMNEDPERLYKAQAMFTATEVSVHEFDPQLRLECERMAPRERQRREEHRKSKGKGKAADNGGLNGVAHAQGIRRSARNNGQLPDYTLTDPTKLERRLKRQRSAEAGAGSHASEEDNADGHTAKRSRVGSEDELDIVGPNSSPPHVLGVRFASDLQPMEVIRESSPLDGRRPNHAPQVSPPASPSPRKPTGFDPFLLNPLPEPGPSGSHLNGMDAMRPFDHAGPSSTVTPELPAPLDFFRGNSAAAPSPQPAIDNPMQVDEPSRSRHSPQDDTPNPPEPMEAERSPTPHPDFHLDEGLLYDLQKAFRDDTGALAVEELEQLRATCLGAVWRHRTDWDRDGLVRELRTVVKEFVEEVADNDMDWGNSPGH